VDELDRVLAPQQTGTHENVGGSGRPLLIEAGQLGDELEARAVSKNRRSPDEAGRFLRKPGKRQRDQPRDLRWAGLRDPGGIL